MLICELCGRQYSAEASYEHLSGHTKEEVEVLKRLKTPEMTEEEYKEFLTNLELETYRSLATWNIG